MAGYMQVLGAVLLAVISGTVLKQRAGEMAAVLTCLCCCLVAAAAIRYLRPAADFIQELCTVGRLDNGMLEILLKAVGVGMITEIASHICEDAGNSALGKTLQILSGCVILWLSLPLLTRLLELVQKILEEA